MIIVHENLQKEASIVAGTIKQVYGLESKIVNKSLGEDFSKIQNLDGYWASNLNNLLEFLNGKAALVVTSRDLYMGPDKNDDWVFGYNTGKTSIVSTARMKRVDNEPSQLLEVPEELYLNRFNVMSVHEIGHSVVRGEHFQMAKWINGQTGHELELGPHCVDNRCSMYEVVDIRAPHPDQGYMLLGKEKKFDAGLDDLITRLVPRWICDRCYSSIKIDERYK